jgi:aspartyl-tRNA(Asn)/glutamyl-tRNA(Gln) amidotransferase subunit A
MATATDPPTALDIASLAEGYRTGALDPVAITETCLARIAKDDPALRAFITVAADSARAQADESRRRFAAGRPLGALDGIPIGIKDNIDVAGLRCTAGTAAFRERVPERDARAVTRLRESGAVLLGKLNMHEGALGATTDNPVYGRCANPLRAGYTPGGSSGGSAAAVAAGFCAASLGTDTMGSVRVPAAYCGVYGFKPSHDAARSDGVVPLSFTLDCVGPLARTIGDLAILADVLHEGPSRRAGHSEDTALAGLRVGVPRQLDAVALTAPVASAFARFLDALRGAGAFVTSVDLPQWESTKARRAGLLISEAEAASYYTHALGPDLPGLSSEFAAMLRYPARAGLDRVIRAYALIDAVRQSYLDAFGEIDLIAVPTTPQPSFPHGIEVPVNQADCSGLANFARAPAVSLPVPTDDLPVGMQLMAAPGDDRRLMSIAVAADRVIARN